jgi:hypothetical protein
MKSGIKELHNFIEVPFVKIIRDAYEHLGILSEADLQAHAWLVIRNFLRQYDAAGKKFRVLNKPYFKDLLIHPDLAIFRRKKPWVLIELKERGELTVRSAKREWDRLIKARKALKKKAVKLKRAYLIYVARRGNGRVLRGPKGPGAKFFFEIPIILEEHLVPERVTTWEQDFRPWAKYTAG